MKAAKIFSYVKGGKRQSTVGTWKAKDDEGSVHNSRKTYDE